MMSSDNTVNNQSKSARLLTVIHGLSSIEERLESLLNQGRGEVTQPVEGSAKEPMPEPNLNTLLMAGPEYIFERQERIHSLIAQLEDVIG